MDGLVRMPGESREDWNKRYGREKMRRLREKKKDPNAPKRLRGKDKKPRITSLPEELRLELERRDGETEAEHKKRYQRAIVARHRVAHAEELRLKRVADYHGEKGARIRAVASQWQQNNPDRVRASQKKYYTNNKEKRFEALVKWKAANPERMRLLKKKWQTDNRELVAASAARCRARAIQAIPKWADWKEIQKVYTLAAKLSRQTGEIYHVDHIVPIAGKNVCGLHVHWNLRAIPAVENMKKHNKFDEELALLFE